MFGLSPLFVLFALLPLGGTVLCGSEGGCGSFGCVSGGCSQCDPPPPCASDPPPPPLPCDSCGRRKREAGVLVSKALNRTCTHEKLKEIMQKAFDPEAETTITNLNSTLHYSDHLLIMCTPKRHTSTKILVKMDHFCEHEDNGNACYVFATGLRAKDVK
uniref:Ground-like domain-containing protein n=1 Tax=Steinernema glaseri TaxID=37863 RepID=A0A1I8AV62_9BILA